MIKKNAIYKIQVHLRLPLRNFLNISGFDLAKPSSKAMHLPEIFDFR